MTHICKFEENTKNYLTRFYEILEEMIRTMGDAELTDNLSHNFILQMIPTIRAPSTCRKMPCDIASAPSCSPYWKISLSPSSRRCGK